MGSLLLRPGEFLVAVEVKQQQRRGAEPALGLASPAHSYVSAAGAPAMQQGSAAESAPAAAPAAPQPSSRSGGGFLRSPRKSCPGSPPAWGPGSHAAMPSSPGQLDSLLPGYLSRPNPSPMKARRLLHPPLPDIPPLDGGSGPAAGVEQGEQQPLPAGGTLLKLAASRYGASGCAKQAGANGAAAPPAPAEAGAGLSGACMGDASATAAGGTAAAAAVPAAGQQGTAGAFEAAASAMELRPLLSGCEPMVAGQPDAAAPAAASGQGLWEDLHAELLSAQQAQQGEPPAVAAAGKEQQGPVAAPAQAHISGRRPRRGGEAAAPAAASAGGQAAATGGRSRKRGRGGAASAAAAEGAGGPAGLLGELAPEAMTQLHLPAAALQLEQKFWAAAVVHVFLMQQHIQVGTNRFTSQMAKDGLTTVTAAPARLTGASP